MTICRGGTRSAGSTRTLPLSVRYLLNNVLMHTLMNAGVLGGMIPPMRGFRQPPQILFN